MNQLLAMAAVFLVAAETTIASPGGDIYENQPANSIELISASVAKDDPVPTTSRIETTDGKGNIYTEGDTVRFKISLSEEHGLQQSIYAFLLCNEDVDISMFGGNPCIITNENVAQAGTTGRQISSTGTSTTGSFTVLDGLGDDVGGQKYSFSVLLCKTRTWDPAQKVEGFPTTEMINILVYNKEPVFDASEPVVVSGFPVEADGITFGSEVPKGQRQTIQPQFNDVSYDLKHGFVYKWTASCDGQEIANGRVMHSALTTEIYAVTNRANGIDSITKYIPEGININTIPFDYNFPRDGLWTIKVEMKDKDMADFSSTFFSFNIVVFDNPQLTVDVDDLYQEDSARAFVHVGLGGYYTADDPIVVKLTVAVPTDGTTNPGRFTLDRNYKAIPQKPADQAEEYPPLYSGTHSNEYYVVFENALEQDILIEEMDGTDNTARKGVTIRAEVVTKTMAYYDPDKTWDEFYLANNVKAYVQNVAPTCNMQEENTSPWVVSGGFATAYPIRWGVYRDVAADFTNEWTYSDGMTSNGVRVTILGCENEQVFYVTNTTSGKFIPNFGTPQGEKNVTIMVEDKDGDFRWYTYRYMVVASKFLTTIANGPSHGTTSSDLSQKYALAPGIGEGHTWVGNGAIFNSADDFRLMWNCSHLNDVDVYAFGYKVEKSIDNGNLDYGRDIAIDKQGHASADENIAPGNFYVYPASLLDDSAKQKDSYFYLLMQHQFDENGRCTSYPCGEIPNPEMPGKYVTFCNVSLPLETDQYGGYEHTYVEAVFAKEFRVADNLGDINQDGVPDVYAVRTWGMGNLIQLLRGGAEGADAINILDYDLVDLSRANVACNEKGEIVGDFLPQIATPDGLQDFTGEKCSYAPSGIPFTARLKLRGFHNGLNATDFTVSDPDFSRDEQLAWMAYSGASSYDAANVDLAQWSPEPGSGNGERLWGFKIDADAENYMDFPYGSFVYAISNNPSVDNRFYTDGMTEIPSDINVCGGLRLVATSGGLALEGLVDGKVETWSIAFASPATVAKPNFSRMDPTLVDTDGDDFPDGWEYFFWYQAHVEYPAHGNDNLRRTGQKYVFEHFNPDNVSEGYEISPLAVRCRFNPCVTLSSFVYNKFPDFDGDGLSDLEELAIGTNPCHWDTDGDGKSDAWEIDNNFDPMIFDEDFNRVPSGWDPIAKEDTLVVFATVFDLAAKASIDADGAVLAAFSQNGECRGVADISEGPFGRLFQLSIGVDNPDEGGIILKVWNPATCEVVEIPERISCSDEKQIGWIGAPYEFTVGGAEMSVALKQGWNWISTCLVQRDASVGAVFASCSFQNGDVVKTAKESATYYDGKWYPSEFKIEPGVAYVVYRSGDGEDTVLFNGTVMEDGLAVEKGWNWIGCTTVETQKISAISHSGGFSDNDIVKTFNKSATCYGGAWYPQEFEIIPGVGYKAKFANSGELSYHGLSATFADSGPSIKMKGNLSFTSGFGLAKPNWQAVVQENTIIAYLRVKKPDGVGCFEAVGSVVAAFTATGECRGVAEIIDGPEDSLLYQLSIGIVDNSEAGFCLKVWDSESERVFDVVDTVSCNEQMRIGEIQSPVILSAYAEISIPEVAPDAAPETVADAIDSAGFADADVKGVIGGSAEKYAAFKEWAQSVKHPGGSPSSATVAGEAAVVANTNAAAAFLLGAERLFENAPKVEIGEVTVGNGEETGGGQGTDRPTEVTVCVTVKDGEEPVSCVAEKVAALFEATGDLGDWTGAAKLTPTVSVESGEGATMRFKVTPGDGTLLRAFLRIHK